MELDNILDIVMEGIKDIERSTVINGRIDTVVEYFPIPVKFSAKNQLATIEIFREKDNMSIFVYDVYLHFDPNGLMYVGTFGHDSITIDNFTEKIEAAMVYEDEDVEDLVTVYLPERLTPGNFVSDFILKFNQITHRKYKIRPYEAPSVEENLS